MKEPAALKFVICRLNMWGTVATGFNMSELQKAIFINTLFFGLYTNRWFVRCNHPHTFISKYHSIITYILWYSKSTSCPNNTAISQCYIRSHITCNSTWKKIISLNKIHNHTYLAIQYSLLQIIYTLLITRLHKNLSVDILYMNVTLSCYWTLKCKAQKKVGSCVFKMMKQWTTPFYCGVANFIQHQ